MLNTVSEEFHGFCHRYGLDMNNIDPVLFGAYIFGPHFQECGYEVYRRGTVTSSGEVKYLILPERVRQNEIFVSTMRLKGKSMYDYNDYFMNLKEWNAFPEVFENGFVNLFLAAINSRYRQETVLSETQQFQKE